MMEDGTTRTQRGSLVSTRLGDDPRTAGAIRIGSEAVVEYRDAKRGERTTVRGVVTQGRRLNSGHAVGIKVTDAADAPGLTTGGEVVVVTGRDSRRADGAPVLRQSTLTETEVGADARVRTPDAAFDSTPEEVEGWRTGHEIAAEVGKHPMRG